MSSVCARVKTLRKILAEVLSASDFEWANIQYCKGRVSKKVCPDDVVESPVTCAQTTKCANPLTVITTGLGSPPSWPVEWEVETRIVKRDWAKNIKPGGTLCLVNSAMEGHCLKFKNRFSATEKQRLSCPFDNNSRRVDGSETESPVKRTKRLQAHPTENVLLPSTPQAFGVLCALCSSTALVVNAGYEHKAQTGEASEPIPKVLVEGHRPGRQQK